MLIISILKHSQNYTFEHSGIYPIMLMWFFSICFFFISYFLLLLNCLQFHFVCLFSGKISSRICKIHIVSNRFYVNSNISFSFFSSFYFQIIIVILKFCLHAASLFALGVTPIRRKNHGILGIYSITFFPGGKICMFT